MKQHTILALSVLLIGSVDLIEDDVAEVEIVEKVDGEYRIIHAAFPVSLFPCTIREGDMFYFQTEDGVSEIRCGEPQI
tara:strand:- start:235 stop:468 length:234 start_codon:yes stop_codon:yes gene_type:complete